MPDRNNRDRKIITKETMPTSSHRRRLLRGISALPLMGPLLPLGSLAAAEQAASPASAPAAPGKNQPNIIFILADDLGVGDLGVYGQTDFATPHLDQLARQGLRMTQAYANSAVCSATRFALITGRYQYRLRGGLEEPIAKANDQIGLPPSHPTLPSLLKQAGYRTALFGKWHLGYLPLYSPLKSGYDIFFGNYGGAIDYFNHKPAVGANVPQGLYEGEVPAPKVGYYTDLITERALEYITKAPAQPFFLSLHYTAPHWPWQGPEDEISTRDLKSLYHNDGGSLATYAKLVGTLDSAVGKIVALLRQRGLLDNTIVIFTSDNGGERFSRTWPFSGQKTELLEGGIRVPAIVHWPARIQAGQVCEQVGISMDWLPTLLAAAGGAPDPAYVPDGENLLPVLLGQAAPHQRTLYWRYKANNQRAMRVGEFKYLKINQNEFLFNLKQDARERANLAQKQPQILAQLKQQWEQWNSAMLPLLKESYTHSVHPKTQADHYRPDADD
ncbi:MAG: hypothetical protein RL748_653 [Pseudomonadota bacterium]|jgi:arylsulfatase A-like enzyme